MQKTGIRNVILTAARARPEAALVAILLFLLFLRLPIGTAADHLDASWRQMLVYAFRHSWQVGIDYVFPFGPLGCLYAPLYDAKLFWTQVTLQAAFTFLMVLTLYYYSIGFASRLGGLVFLLTLLTLRAPHDALYASVIVSVAALLITNPDWPTAPVAFVLAPLVACSLVKFNVLVLATVSVVIVAAAWAARSRSRALQLLGLSLGMFALGWVACGQSVINLPRYISSSLELARGYNEAMSLEGSVTEVVLSLLVVGLGGTLASFGTFVRPRGLNRSLTGALVLIALLLLWKEGFVRHDAHAMIFFAFAVPAPLFLTRAPGWRAATRVTYESLRVAMVLLGVVGYFTVLARLGTSPWSFLTDASRQIGDNLIDLRELSQLREEQDRDVRALKEQYDLPRIREIVGTAAVDIFSFEQGVGLLNGLNLRPRPVFQSYAASTTKLLAANAAFFARDHAPEFVLFKLQPIDLRMPATDDAEALKVILRAYRPVEVEKSYLLMRRAERVTDASHQSTAVVLDRSADFGEAVGVDVSSPGCRILSLDIRYSYWGRLISLLFKPPPVFLEGETTAGAHIRYRIIPGMVRTGFVFDPLIGSQADFIAWLNGAQLPRISSFRLVSSDTRLPHAYKPGFGVRLVRDDSICPE